VAAAAAPAANATSITAVDLKKRMDRGDALTILDVREPNEFQINRIPGAQLIPLGEIPRRYAELDPDAETVVYCKVGARSAKAADYLRTVGFRHVMNLQRGIIDWVDKVDPSQPKY
jgi:adenylyltransferase/sulfurtransferase